MPVEMVRSRWIQDIEDTRCQRLDARLFWHPGEPLPIEVQVSRTAGLRRKPPPERRQLRSQDDRASPCSPVQGTPQNTSEAARPSVAKGRAGSWHRRGKHRSSAAGEGFRQEDRYCAIIVMPVLPRPEVKEVKAIGSNCSLTPPCESTSFARFRGSRRHPLRSLAVTGSERHAAKAQTRMGAQSPQLSQWLPGLGPTTPRKARPRKVQSGNVAAATSLQKRDWTSHRVTKTASTRFFGSCMRKNTWEVHHDNISQSVFPGKGSVVKHVGETVRTFSSTWKIRGMCKHIKRSEKDCNKV
ncbi:uncharacterized protein LOC115499203 [Lynx canadensis]|uniref:uncharacterized protein LOC115499203 n=1 Tax=Lynx canadensis TaxID=61383 RepID=UPI0013C50E70|nr:uncharacterized protein LOC115499203 [Lynx canadensis]